MTMLARPPRRSRDDACAGIRVRRCAACLVLAGVLAGSGGMTSAQAQSSAARPNVEVDLGALDSVTPPPPGAPPSRIRLHMPESTAKPPAAKKPATQASTPTAAPQPAKGAPPAAATTASTESLTPDFRRIPPPPNLPPAAVAPSPPAPTSAASTPTPPAPTSATASAEPQAAPQKPKSAAATVGPVADQILFPADGVKLPDDAKAELNQLAKRLSADGHLYVQLIGYAGGEADASQARRISLSRALAARSYLVDQGVQIKQVDVRPLGNKTDPNLPPDRVDLVVAER